ncbi:MAG: gliding motility-associated C-terminal domain-containing protein, partial [Bacteroidota bacterium]
IVVTSAGAIFDPLIFDPAATITTPQTGAGLVTAEFCWVTSCEQGQELPYQFVASATDDGCPPKTTDFVFQVEVIPFDGPTFIDGNPNPCEDAEYDYETEFFDGANYAWVATGGTVITGQGTNVVTVDWGATGMGMLSVVATNHLGCIADPVDLSINIQNLPAVNAGNDEIICIGDSVQIGGAPTGPVGAVYNWLPADSISDTAVENPIVFPSENTAYIVQVITGFSCLGEDTVDVIVNIPQIDAGDDLSICLGDSVQLNGVNGTSYLWTPSDSLTVDNIADPIAFPADTTVYLVTGPDANTCIGIDSTTVFVLPQPIAFAGPDTVICGLSYDMQASFSVGTDGLWRPQAGINYTDDTSASTLVQVDAEGIYTFTWLEGNANCLDSSEVTIQFIAQPLADAGINDSICGLVFDLQAQSSVGIGTWTLPAGLNIMPSANDPNAVLTADNFGVYSIQWDENNNGCADTSIIEINFIEQPVINAGLNDSICGLEYTFSGSITAGLGTWTANGIAFTDENDPFATATASDNGLAEIIWTANNQNFCFATDTVEIDFQEIPTAEAGDDQSLCADSAILDASTTGAGMWVFPAGVNLSDPSDPNAVLTATPLGSYQLFWNTIIGQCTNSDSVQIELLQSATADAGLDTPICIGDDLTLNGSGGDDYTWTPDSFIDDVNSQNPTVNPDASITYFLEVSLNNGCTDTDSVIVTVNPLPIVDAGEDIDYLCDGDSIQLIATPGFSGYSWSPAGDVSDPLIENPFATGDFTADYVVTVTDANNCMNSDTINIVINGIVPTDAGEDFAICLGDSVQLGATPVGPDGTTYQWTPATGLDDALAENPMAIPTETTTYIVQSTNSICNGADTLIVEIIAVDIPDFEFSLVPGCDGLLVNFFNLGVEDLSYAWDFGDGASSSAYSPSHTYAFNGNFQVGLEVTTAENCVGENSALIDSDSFEEYFQVLVPNVITPNQDGENDILDINVRGNIQECIEFKVFNRWGQVMFNSSGNNTRWDGRTNAGILVSPGVYFYVLELNGQSFKGDIQVIY